MPLIKRQVAGILHTGGGMISECTSKNVKTISTSESEIQSLFNPVSLAQQRTQSTPKMTSCVFRLENFAFEHPMR
ncbi:MAG: hypothetical protein ABJZ55_21435 [Fuerstiella sp.]